MKSHFLQAVILLATVLRLPLGAYCQGDRATIDSLYHQLSLMKTAADSLPVMCNLYDVLPRDKSTKLGHLVIETADRAGHPSEALDLIRNQANRYMRSDSMLKELRARALRFPESEERAETITFIRMMQNMRKARYSDREERNKTLTEYIKVMTLEPPVDKYEHIALLHGICMLISQEPNGEMLGVYLDSLSSIVNKLPASAFSIRNAFGVHAAVAYMMTSPHKSVACDRALLHDVSRLEEYYHEKGRKFRSYSPTYYTVYTRLLSNFEILDSVTIEKYYEKVKECVEEDDAVRATYEKFPAADIYLALSKGDYAAALPLLKKHYDSPSNLFRKRQMLGYLMRAAENQGDLETQRMAATLYANLLEEEILELGKGMSQDLQLAYAVYNVKNKYGDMELEKKRELASMQRKVITITSCALVVLVILLVIVFILYRRNRHLVNHLAASNRSLQTESENLRQSRAESIRARDIAQKANNLKSDFIKNMSYEVKVPLQAINEYSHLIADCVGDTGHRHLKEFADLVELNSELLSTIINDVLRLSEIDSASMPVQSQVVNVKLLTQFTLESVKRRVKPGVELKLDAPAERIDIFTDPARVQQILNALLTNAAKFTSEGCITLGYRLADGGSKLEFSVTDTGIGINPDNKERIFDRFVKLDSETQGAGLGLTIARLIARLLGGDVTLDTTYRGGARFLLTLPKK